MDVSELKKGAKIKINEHPHSVVEFQFVKPGKGQGLYKCKLRNLVTGAAFERTFRSGEKLEAADVETRQFSYLFASGDSYTFMDAATYEQVEVSEEIVGDGKHFLTDQLQVDLLFNDGKVIDCSLPSHVVMEITECAPGVKGDTAQGATKDASIETGYTFQVPLFIKQGEKVKLDTRTGDYVERVND